ncbi:MAG: pyridoxamine 5'-phosphate oxidase family protein [Actinobacteria bacterium]|nr:pyridoxamine 5'-phosphate oxidase family protein [Actinomycetota bacterium]
MAPELTIDSVDGLREIYRPPAQRSLDKEVDHLDRHCRDFILHAPFAVLATGSAGGRVDVSPKGGTPGFVAVLDDHHLALPDMAGNNRLDSLQNIVGSGHASLLFLVPGVDETLRVVGRASISVDPDVLERCPIEGMRPNVAVVLEVQTAYIHCAKAFRRSGLWHPERWPDTSDMATTACMLADHVGMPSGEINAAFLEASYAKTTWKMGGEPA